MLNSNEPIGPFFAILAAAKRFRQCGLAVYGEEKADMLVFSFLLETFFDVRVLTFGLPVPTLTPDHRSHGAMVIAPQLGQFPMHFAQALPAFFRVGLLFQQGSRQLGKFHRQQAGKQVADFLSI